MKKQTEICKVYLSTQTEERTFKQSKYTFGVVLKTEIIKEDRVDDFIKQILHLRPINYIPDSIDFYRNKSQVLFKGDYITHIREN